MRLFWILLAILGGGLLVLLVNGDSGRLGFDGDLGASLVQMTAIGVMVAAGIVASRTAFGAALRNIALWLLIILIFVAGYQYRYELQDIASRVTAGLVPGSPISIRTADGANVVQLDKAGDTHFGARGAVNGKPVAFLVDTGASATVLTAADAASLGFGRDQLTFNIPVSTANGVANAARITVDTIEIGSIRRGPMRIMVAEDRLLAQSLLGMDFIGTLSGFDLRGDRLMLRD